MRDVGEGFDLRVEFIREVMWAREEYEDFTILHALSGKKPERTGRWFCPYCDRYLSEEACSGYEAEVNRELRRLVIDDYMIVTCPECHEPVDEQHRVNVVEEIAASTSPHAESTPRKPEVKQMVQYLPCEHLFEADSERLRWDLDREKLQKDVSEGKIARSCGLVFRDSRGA